MDIGPVESAPVEALIEVGNLTDEKSLVVNLNLYEVQRIMTALSFSYDVLGDESRDIKDDLVLIYNEIVRQVDAQINVEESAE